MRYLLDTNFISELCKGDRANRGVQTWAMSHDSGLWAISVITLGEIRKGIEDKRRTDIQQANAIEGWLDTVMSDFAENILSVNVGIADRWGRLVSHARLPSVDLMLAATALGHNLTLIARNTNDFKGSGARIYNPWK